MNLVFTNQEYDTLIVFMTNSAEDANSLGEIGLKCFENGNLEKEVSGEILIPNLPDYISKTGQELKFHNTQIAEIFIAYHFLSKNGITKISETFDELNSLNFGKRFKIKPDSIDEYYLILLNRKHNYKILDLFSAAGNDFWSIYHIFTKTFAFVNISKEDFCEVLEIIVVKTENDMTAGMIYNVLKAIPAHNLQYAEDLYNSLLTKENESIIRYTAPLVEGMAKYKEPAFFHEKCLKQLESETINVVRAGLTTFCSIDYSEVELLAKGAYNAALPFLNDKRENINFSATHVMIALSKYIPEAVNELRELSKKEDLAYRYPIADHVWRNTTDAKPTDFFKELSFNLSSFKTESSNMINSVNWHIADAYKNDEREYAFLLLEAWLKNGQSVNLMEHALTKLINIDFSWFCKCVTPWFISSNRNLINALNSITSKWDNRKFKLDKDILNTYSTENVIKTTQAIAGFIFAKEPLATLILSILDSKHVEDQAGNVESLFSDYICYTYPSTLDDFVKPEILLSKDTKKKVLQNIVQRIDEYFNSLRKLPKLQELSGSDIRRSTYNKVFDKKQSKAINDSRKDSIWEQVARNVIMRSGDSWFSKTNGHYGAESKLAPMNFSFEMPRAEYIDPATFEAFRLRMRYEALK